ncbi:MAG: hypothetical protein FWF83_06565, partial [Clostridiales bacterium]|nr:hypothetical protein [Clostridiales bacterium]
FSFELFKKNDASGLYDILIRTYTNDASSDAKVGKVEATDLDPGEYMFKEVISADLNFDGMAEDVSYRPVWKAVYPKDEDGLYFEITAAGKTIWPQGAELDADGNPTVDNEILCKHNVLWAPDDFDPYSNFFREGGFEVVELGVGLGKLIYFNEYCHGRLVIVETVEPSCERAGVIWLGCSDNCGIGTGIEFGEILEHDFRPVAIAPGYGDGMVWYGCANGCGGSYVNFDKEAWLALGGSEFYGAHDCEWVLHSIAPGVGDGFVWSQCALCGGFSVAYNAAAWYDMGGYAFTPPYEALALAPGYGDGFVWVEYTDGSGSAVLYDKAAWLALGGYDFADPHDCEWVFHSIAPGMGAGIVWLECTVCGALTFEYNEELWYANGGEPIVTLDAGYTLVINLEIETKTFAGYDDDGDEIYDYDYSYEELASFAVSNGGSIDFVIPDLDEWYQILIKDEMGVLADGFLNTGDGYFEDEDFKVSYTWAGSTVTITLTVAD